MSVKLGIGNISLFMVLAFVMPGLVYAFAFVIYFQDLIQGEILILINNILTLPNYEFNLVSAFILFAIFIGLVLTAICHVIEVLFWAIYKKCKNKKGGSVVRTSFFDLVTEEDSETKITYYNQVKGQYVMHVNIAIGLTLLLIAFTISNFLVDNSYELKWFLIILFSSLLIIAANYYLSFRFNKIVNKVRLKQKVKTS